MSQKYAKKSAQNVITLWNKLTFSQRLSLIFVLSFVAATPLAIVASLNTTNDFRSKAASNTPPLRQLTITPGVETNKPVCNRTVSDWSRDINKLPISITAGKIKYSRIEIFETLKTQSDDITVELLRKLFVAKINKSLGFHTENDDKLIEKCDDYLSRYLKKTNLSAEIKTLGKSLNNQLDFLINNSTCPQ